MHTSPWADLKLGALSCEDFRAVMSRQTYAVYTVSSRHCFSEVRHAILEPCRQVRIASFTFLGLLTGRWHTLCCSGALWHVCAPSADWLNSSTCDCTGGRSRPQSAAQEFPSFSAVYVQIHEQIWETRIARISGRSCRDRLTRCTLYHRDIAAVK